MEGKGKGSRCVGVMFGTWRWWQDLLRKISTFNKKGYLFSHVLAKNENMRKFFNYHHDVTTLKIIDVSQVFIIVSVILIVIINWLWHWVDVFSLILVSIILIGGTLLLPPLYYRMQYEQQSLMMKQVGLMILYEFTIVLETTRSLSEAVLMVVKGDYPYYSRIFKEALVRSYFGCSLESALTEELNQLPFSDVNIHFMRLLSRWNSSRAFLEHFKNEMHGNLQLELREKNRYLGMYSTLYMALACILPPILVILLILNRLFLQGFGIVIIMYAMIFFLGSPFKIIFAMARSWGLEPRKSGLSSMKTSAMLSELKDLVSDRMVINRALVHLLGMVKGNSLMKARVKMLVSLGFPFSHQKMQSSLVNIFGRKAAFFLQLCHRFFIQDDNTAHRVITELSRGIRTLEQAIEEVISTINSEKRRFILILSISLFVMGILTNMIGIFKIISILSGSDGIQVIGNLIESQDVTYSQLINDQELFLEKIAIALYSLFSCLFLLLYVPLPSRGMEHSLSRKAPARRFLRIKNVLSTFILKSGNLIFYYAFYILGFVLSGVFLGIF